LEEAMDLPQDGQQDDDDDDEFTCPSADFENIF